MYGKGQLEQYDERFDIAVVGFGDTNLPYLWSVEGIARLIKGVLGIEKGIPSVNVKKSDYKLIAEESVSAIRPYIAAFVAKNREVDDYLIKQIIQLQEKLCENFGRRRQKIAIGVYSHKKIKFPIHYKATNPESIKFVPLDFRREMTQQEIVEEHPKGKEYAWILKGFKKYPILVDDKNDVLSFPPIINSATTGKVEIGERDLFFEVTGTDIESVNLTANIFANSLYDRGFDIYSVEVSYAPGKVKPAKMMTPTLKCDEIKVRSEDIISLLGIELRDPDIKALLEKARYDAKAIQNGFIVKIPSYRGDIMHAFDVVEDIGIMYGYERFAGLELTKFTAGKSIPIVGLIDKTRDIAVGLGFQEVLSPILTNKELLYDRMNAKDFGTIEIKNPMTQIYSCVRSWLLPILMDFLSKNKHNEYPQRIFEQGLVTVRKNEGNNEKVFDYERLALVSANNNANYTEIRQYLDDILHTLGIEYTIEETSHESFIEGRVARVYIKAKDGKKKGIAFLGEINPKVLENFGIDVPVAALELNLTDVFNAFS